MLFCCRVMAGESSVDKNRSYGEEMFRKVEEFYSEQIIQNVILPRAVDDRVLPIYEKAKKNDPDECFILSRIFGYLAGRGYDFDPPVEDFYVSLCFEVSDYWLNKAIELNSPEAILSLDASEIKQKEGKSGKDRQRQALAKLLSMASPTDLQAEVIVRAILNARGVQKETPKARDIYEKFLKAGKKIPPIKSLNVSCDQLME